MTGKGAFQKGGALFSAEFLLVSHLPQSARTEKEQTMALSARNHLKGEVTEVLLGTVTALITVKVGDNMVESVITKRSAEELKLKKGDKVTAVIKATEVMIQKD
jgi:molybdopterin-binding protein